jgi:hypothetical protein
VLRARVRDAATSVVRIIIAQVGLSQSGDDAIGGVEGDSGTAAHQRFPPLPSCKVRMTE